MNPTEKYNFDKRTQETLEHLTVPFAVYQFVDKRVATLVLSDGFCRLFGYEDRGQAYHDMDNDMYKDVHPDDVARIANAAFDFATKGGKYEVVYRTKIMDGPGYRIVHAYGEHVYTDTGVRLAHVWYSDEGIYTEQPGQQEIELNQSLSNALHENSIVKASQYDYLTGLPNMTYFFELAKAGKETAQKKGVKYVLLYMNFSGMKHFNMKHGFAEGDKLLQSFAKILAETFGNEQSCRIGTDHFAVLTEETDLEEKLQQLFRECREMNGGNTLPVHVGVYVGQNENIHVSVACDRAKLACTALGGRYETAVNYYRQELREEAVRKRYIIENIDRAIKEKWIQMYLQPIIRTVTERVCDVEALARWIDPEKGFLSPADFIPALEDAGLIYKLDLYMVDQILDSMKEEKAAGFYIVPHSVNLSRSDFDACDIVEEIRRRVDKAGVDRALITIEITESIIGSDLAFMKEQVERFRNLGFPVWMDDFGSGYSSLDVLQSIQFDLIKFDMSFMRKLDEGDGGKIILTELMRMAASLGVDTVCEGVETGEQVHFLREIGCSKLQGFYFSKPISLETLKALHESNTLIPRENSQESKYYERIGRVNLFDLSFLANLDDSVTKNTFDTVPMAIMEVNADGGKVKYIRSNQTFRDFIRRAFGFNLSDPDLEYPIPQEGPGSDFMKAIEQSKDNNNRAFVDEKMRDGTAVRSFVRIIGKNPVNGRESVAIAVLSIREPGEGETFADIAQALAADYYNIFVIDLDSNDYIEYSSQAGGKELSVVRHGEDFFESARRDTMTRVYKEDQEPFLALFTKERVLRDIDSRGVFTTTYRLIDTGTPMYVNMKITRLRGGNRLILGISIIDAHMKEQEEARRLRQEKVALGRIAALSPDYIVLYTVDPETGRYTQYNPSKGFADFGLATYGEDFFADVVLDAPKAIPQEDIERHLRILTKENMLREIRENGFFIYHYRLKMDGKTVHVNLRATMVRGTDGDRIILGVTNDEEEYRRKLEEAQKIGALNQTITSLLDSIPGMAFTKDAETGVYLACNQAFAEYAHKAMPDGVVGLTDAEIFDAETAAHFVQDDQSALLMDKPYIFFEDVPDAAGNQRQFWTTKLKYTDASGRLCLQGFCQDVTDILRLQRENTRAKEDFQKAVDTATIYARLQAITGNFIVVYVVDPQTNRYREFSSTDDYLENFGTDKEGLDFFSSVRKDACVYAYPQDLNRFLSIFTKENVLAEIERSGIFTWGYRIMMDGKPLHVHMKAVMVEEKEGQRLVVGLVDIDAQVRQEEELKKRLAQAQIAANIDDLTGIKNRHAFLTAQARLDHQIAERTQSPFATVVLDVNDLKIVNDTAGHQAGDQYLQDACQIICDIFKRSPVFRMGGDEFVVIAQGSDYERMEELLGKLDAHNAEALRTGGIVIACGMAKFDDDPCVDAVLERADRNMYKNKNRLKR